MDTVQGRLSYIQYTVDQIRLRYVYRKLRDLALYRSQLLMRVLAGGPLHVKAIEIAMYQAGDKTISQATVSIFIHTLLRYDLIVRIYPEDEPRQLHFYSLRHRNVRKIQEALDRFNAHPPP